MKRQSVLAALLLIGALSGVCAAQTDPNMVLIPTTVTAGKDAAVPGLKQENFKIAEGNADQKITFFSPDNSPAAIGFILGAGALAQRADTVSTSIRTAVETFQKSGHPQNEYFVDPFGQDGVDGVVVKSLQKLVRSANPRKTLIVIMDTFDNPGGNPEQPSMDGPLKQGVPIYFIFLSNTQSNRGFSQNWMTTIEEVARSTGGKVMYFDPQNELRTELVKLADELKNQYVLGYTSSNGVQDGKWRNVKITVTPPGGTKVNVRTKSRYFVAKR